MTQFNPFIHLDNISNDELIYLNQITANLNETQLRSFVQIYATRRKKAQEILIYTLLGLIIIAGVQRFVLGQIAMGIIYFLTGGFCLIGTIVDLINHKSMTNEYNRKVAGEVMQIIS
jgi:TM2 domain-containing membrane protein YozV